MSTNKAPASLRGRTLLLMISVALFAFTMAACESKPENQNANQNARPSAANANQAAPATANQNVTPPAANANVANANQAATAASQKTHTVTIDTSAGRIKIELLDKDAPKTAENFRKLAQQGFYNGLIFHRIVNGFMIQGGDPNGNGTGGKTADGQPLPNEVVRASPLYQNGYHRGDVAMANRGAPETGSSQFFIMHQDRGLNSLPPNYTIFARVTEGMNIVDKIISAPVAPGTERPANPIKMTKVTVQ
ncbi:MAG TPA: peptidylprolyl isomerase [Blastocatellia bacterium]|nr:peptidylprolyl isomerase [Blastocatellia bacterium]